MEIDLTIIACFAFAGAIAIAITIINNVYKLKLDMQEFENAQRVDAIKRMKEERNREDALELLKQLSELETKSESENQTTSCKPYRTCSVVGCDGKHVARGYCRKHYAQICKKK